MAYVAAMQRNTVLFMVLLNSFTTPMMLSAANIALPAIAGELGLSAVSISWVPMIYLMAAAMFVLIFGRIADVVGRKRIFLIGTLAVIISSCLAAASISGPMLLAARFLQGFSAAMLYSTQMAIVTSVFPDDQRGRVIGLVVAVTYIGLAAGPLIGGVVIDSFGWRYSFLLQLPLALLVLFIGFVIVRQEWSAEESSAFDYRGAAAYSSAILLLCLGVSRLPAWDSLLLFAGGAALTVYFLRHARRVANPIWDIRVFFSSRVFSFSCATAMIVYSATYATVMLLSLYLQYVLQYSATRAGMLIMIQPVTMALLSPLIGRLSDRLEPRLLSSLGIGMIAVGLVMLAALDAGSSSSRVALALLTTGTGFSLFSSPNANAIMGSVGHEYAGSASAAVAITRMLGQLGSITLVTLIMTLVVGSITISPETQPQLEWAITLSFSIAALICLPGVLMSLRRGRLHGEGGLSQDAAN